MSDDVREIRIQANLGDRAFYGVQLSETTTETGWHPRWVEMALYRMWDVERDKDGVPADPVVPVAATGYVVYSNGRSVVYHRHPGGCKTGTPMRAKDLHRDGEPCRECKPGRITDLRPDQWVREEDDLITITTCTTPEDVLRALRAPRSGSDLTEVPSLDQLSQPAVNLLRKAKVRDEGIKRVTDVVERLDMGR